MDATEQAAALLALPDAPARGAYLAEWLDTAAPEDNSALAEALKERAITLQRGDVEAALDAAATIHLLADGSDDPRIRALGYRMEAQALVIGRGQFKEALVVYDQALDIYRACDDAAGEALTQVTRIWALGSLGRYDEALATGQAAAEVLEAKGLWLPAASLTNNLAGIYFRLGRDFESLGMLERAGAAYEQAGEKGVPFLTSNALSRGVVLRKLGRFDDAIASTRAAEETARELKQTARIAGARQNLALIDLAMGRYNDALQRLDEARDIFLDDGRVRDAMLVELFLSNCLLELRRFDEVLDKAQKARALFTDRGTQIEIAQCYLNEAIAYAALGRPDPALESLAAARVLFEEEGNGAWVAIADLQRAILLSRAGEPRAAFDLALDAAVTFIAHDMAVETAQARLAAAQAATQIPDDAQALAQAEAALALGQAQDLPGVIHQAYLLRGRVAQGQGRMAEAAADYDRAIEQLERLQGRLMLEYRSAFLGDKLAVYEDSLLLSLERGQPDAGLAYAERAKSRALLDMISYRLHLGVAARSDEDRPLVEELERLRDERDRIYRVWESGEAGDRFGAPSRDPGNPLPHQVLALEQQITETWHRLMVRNADYARDAALWQVQVEPAQPYLDADTLLIEYFVARDRLVAFLVTSESVRAECLPAGPAQVQANQKFLGLNLRAVPHTALDRRDALTGQAQGILRRLHDQLLSPLGDALANYERLIIVPHGPLHYLPFHALFDGEAYLGQRHCLSYLPGASFLKYGRDGGGRGQGAFVAGHSRDGQLPQTLEEARAIAGLWQTKPLLEAAATLDSVQQGMAGCDLIHLAMHGDFRPDNPLFSGLLLADGWLTTLDIFGLRLRASLVTLSACQTGRHVVAGGDELLGLMRAFLSAGASSLLLTHWPVEDQSAARFMASFYRQLLGGRDKAAALQDVQTEFLSDPTGPHAHPYFWAPFYLVGSPRPLAAGS